MNSINDPSLCSRNKRKPSRTLVHVALAFLSMPLAACGGSSSSPTAPTPVAVSTPQPCAQAVLFQGAGAIPPGTVQSMGIAADMPARFDITSDWTFATNPVGLYLVQGSCNLDQFNARSCNFVFRVEPGAKPLKGSGTVTPGIAYNVMLANFGSRDDSGTLQIVRSTGNCPAMTASSSASDTGTVRTVSRLQTFGR